MGPEKYEWSDVCVMVAGHPVTTELRRVKYSSKQAEKYLYDKRNKPHRIRRDSKTFDCKITGRSLRMNIRVSMLIRIPLSHRCKRERR